MELLTQTDKRWKNEKMGKSKCKIGDSGCVITSLCNTYNLNGGDFTPDELNRILGDNGYTKDGDLYWACAEKILNCKIQHKAWVKEQGIGKMNEVLNERISFYHHIICRYINSGYQHFTNVINVFGNYIIVFDVYDGKIKVLHKTDINRLVIVDYKK
jgi:hypothetical protein